MKVLIVSQAQVPALLTMADCMDVVSEALKALARDEVILPLRPIMWLPEKVGALVLMPAFLGNLPAMGLKVISVFPGNHNTEFDAHQGAVLLFETVHGQLLAIVDATAVTAIRTAAVSGLATKLLAPPEAGDLAIFGTGTQARLHLEAMLLARPIRRVRVWSRTPEHVRAFAERESARHNVRVEAAADPQSALEGADLICTTTSATEPVLRGEWLRPGVHINAAGSTVPFTRELDTAAMVKARVYVDRRDSMLNEAGDYLFAHKEGALGPDHILGELGEVLLGRVAGRGAPEEITLFKSLGLAIEDVASASHIYHRARANGGGTAIELGGSHFGSA